jgi:DNA-binding Lrp family transcriptional regulator
MDIDLKDRKILYYLDLNCRQSNTQIGKKVGLSRKVVEYRIKKMEHEGIITGYWTEIDSYRFGYQVYRFYLIFQNVTPTIKEDIIEYLVNYSNTWVVAPIKVVYDLSVVVWVKNISKFLKFWDSFNEKYGDYVSDKLFSIYLEADVYPLSYLLEDEYSKSDRKEHVGRTGCGDITNVDEMDYAILNELVDNARKPVVEITKSLGCSSQSINYRIKNLIKKGIIQGFHIGINNSKIGFKEFKVDIWLSKISKRKEIWNYLRYNKYVTFINTSAGYADLEIEFTIENSDKLIKIMEDISYNFSNAIRKYIFWESEPVYKLNSLPELSEKDFKKL